MTQAEQIAMNVWNEIIARPRNQRKGISYAQLEKVVQRSMCSHYFPATRTGYMDCEFCGEKHKSNKS